MKIESQVKALFNRFVRDESGTTAIEYSLIGTIIGIACVAIFISVGDSMVNLFGSEDSGASPVLESAAATAAGEEE